MVSALLEPPDRYSVRGDSQDGTRMRAAVMIVNFDMSHRVWL
jgi:hypothetical protein